MGELFVGSLYFCITLHSKMVAYGFNHVQKGIRVRYYIIITTVRSYTGKYYKFVAACIVTSAQHE